MAIAWVAGFYDGEGCVGFWKRSQTRRVVVIQIGQADRGLLDRVATITGMGKVYGPYRTKGRPHTKPIYSFRVYRHVKVVAFAMLIWEWIGPIKRAQFLRHGVDGHTTPAPVREEWDHDLEWP